MLLVHKVMRAAEEQGFREGRLLLQDWLVVLLSKYQHHYSAHPDSILYPEQMCPALATVPRYVYGLLRGPLLSSNTPLSAHRLSADLRTWMYTLYRSLPVVDLCVAILPTLAAYRHPNQCVTRGLSLTWEAVQRTGCRLFLLDACTHIYVYAYQPPPLPDAVGADTLPAPLDFEFPPAKTSALWKDVIRL